MRHVNNAGMVAFHVFQAIPFVYELRALLVSSRRMPFFAVG